jgi:rhodanese-related sulfurtransferase
MTEQPSVLSVAELRALLDSEPSAWLVYAPDAASFVDGHIPGSLEMPESSVLVALAARAPVVVYGEDAEAARAAGVVRARPDLDLRWFRDGLAGWASHGLPVDVLGGRTDL